jgi:glycosyltransferase involved in cell wall biosynthesis
MYFVKPAPFLEEALASIATQRTERVEIIVVAGHAEGEELGISAGLLAAVDRLIVETDEGAWDAANKGWRAARGEWVQFCMSDDWLPEGSIEKTLHALEEQPEADILSGAMSFVVWDPARGLRPFRSRPAQELALDRVLDDVASPAVIYRRSLLARLGGLDGRFIQAHDRALLLRAWHQGAPHRRLAHEIYRMRIHGLSRTTSGDPRVRTNYWRDHVTFADDLLRTGDLHDDQRCRLQRWRDEEFVKFQIVRRLHGLDVPPLGAQLPIHRAIGGLFRLACRKLRRAFRIAPNHRRDH